MGQDDELQNRKALLAAMRGRSPTFILLSIALSGLGWLLAYISHCLTIGIIVQVIAIAIPTERYFDIRRFAKYTETHGKPYDVNKL